jgi:hypothetical protein
MSSAGRVCGATSEEKQGRGRVSQGSEQFVLEDEPPKKEMFALFSPLEGVFSVRG